MEFLMEMRIKQTTEEVCINCIVKSICSSKCETFLVELRKKCVKITIKNGCYITNPQFIDYNDGLGIQICGGLSYLPDGTLIGHIDPPGPRGIVGIKIKE